MQSQCRYKEEKDEHDAQFDEKQQDQSPELSLVDFKEVRRPGDTGIPKHVRGDEIEQGKREADDKCPEEKVPEEDDFVMFHAAPLFISNGPDQFMHRHFERANAIGLPHNDVMTITKNLGMLVLAIYLICVGLVGLVGLSLGIVPAILAIVAGILILIGR